jgi:hypothetical protein
MLVKQLLDILGREYLNDWEFLNIVGDAIWRLPFFSGFWFFS